MGSVSAAKRRERKTLPGGVPRHACAIGNIIDLHRLKGHAS